MPVTDAMLRDPDPEDWISFRNGYALWGYSSLDQIDAGNVDGLQLVWSRAMNEGYQEVEPIVYDGVMFLANVEDIVQALDARTGDLLWEYRRALPDNIAGVTGTRYRYRNVSIYDDKILLATNDAFLVALDARTGEVVWETERADYHERVAQTAGPVIINGKVVNGSRCNPNSPRPGGCFISAHDVGHGEEVWRINTAATPDQPGGDTWGGLPVSARRHASAWMVGSYDPALNLTFWGTGPPAPLPEALRGAGKADLLYTNSTLALDPDTGEMMWYFQHLPRDNWDLDHVFERMIVETTISPNPAAVPWISPDVRPGETRKVITGIPGKTGLVWTLDAETGMFLWARPTVYQNIMTGLDLRTGRPIIDESTTPQSVENASSPAHICWVARTSRRAPTARTPTRSTCHSTTPAWTSRCRSRSPDRATATTFASRCVTDRTWIPIRPRSGGSRRCRLRRARHAGPISSVRRSTARCWRRAGISSSRATSFAGSGRWMPTRVQSGGRRS